MEFRDRAHSSVSSVKERGNVSEGLKAQLSADAGLGLQGSMGV